MVGVPGRSKGCNTCRKRKIKCDGEKPQCGQCRKSSRICAGYERVRYFKNLSALDHDTLLARSQPIVPLTEPSVIRVGVSPNDSLYVRQSGHFLEAAVAAEPNPCRSLVPSVTSNVTVLFGRFLEQYVPPEGLNGAESEFRLSWLQVLLLDLPRRNMSLDLAVAALSMVRLGRNYRDDRLRMEGMEMYGRALDGMRKVLRREELLYEEQTLATCMTMVVFETLETSAEKARGWTSHVQGLSRLIQLRGPAAHVDSQSHQLFLGFRPTEIIHAIALRKKSYLADPQWLSIPWSKTPKNSFHSLLDIMARLTGLIEASQQILHSSSSQDLLETASFFNDSWLLEQQLRSWYSNLEPASGGPLYTEVSIDKPYRDEVFPTKLHFESLPMARQHLLYWSSLLLLYNSLSEICEHYSTEDHHQLYTAIRARFSTIASHSLGSSKHPLISLILELHDKSVAIARLLAKAINFLLAEDMTMLAPQNALFPLRVALHVFSRQPGREAAWCEDKFRELDRRGFPFAKILFDVEWDDFPVALSQSS